jgi:hypothetical protein
MPELCAIFDGPNISTMSWNKYCIIITNVEETDLIKAVNLTGYHILTPSSEVDFRTAFDNRGDEMPFGLIDKCLWILSPTQVDKFFSETPSALEKNLCKKFPDSTIIALEENSTVDSFGFSLIRNGKRVRVLNGCDGEYYFDYGDPIDEEINSYNKVVKELCEEEKLEIIENEGQDGLERYFLFEAKWRVPFELFKNVYGKTIEQVYDENKSFRYFRYDK